LITDHIHHTGSVIIGHVKLFGCASQIKGYIPQFEIVVAIDIVSGTNHFRAIHPETLITYYYTQTPKHFHDVLSGVTAIG
jgi:hypothetical protein